MKKIDKVETISYFLDNNFEWPMNDLLNCLENLKEFDGMDWEDNYHWFHGKTDLADYLVDKSVLYKNPKYNCYHLTSEEKRSEFYNSVVKISII